MKKAHAVILVLLMLLTLLTACGGEKTQLEATEVAIPELETA